MDVISVIVGYQTFLLFCSLSRFFFQVTCFPPAMHTFHFLHSPWSFSPSFSTYRDIFMSWSGVISYLQGSPPTAAYAALNDGVFCCLSGKPLAWSPCQPEPGSYQCLKTWSTTSHGESLICQYLCSRCRDRFGFRLCSLERYSRTIWTRTRFLNDEHRSQFL